MDMMSKECQRLEYELSANAMLLCMRSLRAHGLARDFAAFWAEVSTETVIAAGLWADKRLRTGVPRIQVDLASVDRLSTEVLVNASAEMVRHVVDERRLRHLFALTHVHVAMTMYSESKDRFCGDCLLRFLVTLGSFNLATYQKSLAWFEQELLDEAYTDNDAIVGDRATIPVCIHDGECFEILLQRVEAIRNNDDDSRDARELVPVTSAVTAARSVGEMGKNIVLPLGIMVVLGYYSAPDPQQFVDSSRPMIAMVNPPAPQLGGSGFLASLAVSMPGAIRRSGMKHNVAISGEGSRRPGQEMADVNPTVRGSDPRFASTTGQSSSGAGTGAPGALADVSLGGTGGTSAPGGFPATSGETGVGGGVGRNVGGNSGVAGGVGMGGSEGTRVGPGSEPSVSTSTRSGALVVRAIGIRSPIMGALMARMGQRDSCSVSLKDGSSYTITKSTRTITGPFEADQVNQQERAERVLGAALASGRCEE